LAAFLMAVLVLVLVFLLFFFERKIGDSIS